MTDTKPPAPPATDDRPVDLAEEIKKISRGFEALKKTGLKRSAIVVLLKDATGLGKRQIEKVLDGLADLEKNYLSTKR